MKTKWRNGKGQEMTTGGLITMILIFLLIVGGIGYFYGSATKEKAMKKEITAIQQELKDTKSTLDTKEKRLADATHDLNRLKADNKKKVDEAAEKLTLEKDEKIQELKNSNEQLSKEKSELTKKIKELEEQPQQDTAPVSESQPIEEAQPSQEYVHYANCTEARNAGVTPIYKGEPGYASHLDRDGDGVACE